MPCLSGFELYSRWVPLMLASSFLQAVQLGFWIPIASGKITITLHRATFNTTTLQFEDVNS